jgi:hypothetical protein
LLAVYIRDIRYDVPVPDIDIVSIFLRGYETVFVGFKHRIIGRLEQVIIIIVHLQYLPVLIDQNDIVNYVRPQIGIFFEHQLACLYGREIIVNAI